MLIQPEKTEVPYHEVFHLHHQRLRTRQKENIRNLSIRLFGNLKIKRWSRSLASFLGKPQTETYAFLHRLKNAYETQELEEWLNIINEFSIFPGYPFMLKTDFYSHIGYVHRYFKKIANRNLPKVPFIAFQKTASSFVNVVLCQLLNVSPTVLSFNHIKGMPSWVNAFAKWGGVTHEHYTPTRENLNLLYNAGIKKCIIHTRHPLRMLISLAFHAVNLNMRINNQQVTDENQRILLMQNYLDRDMERVINSYSLWLQQWRAESASGRIEILETSYEDMKEDPLAFFKRIMDFYGIDFNERRLIHILKKQHPEKNNKGYNFRKAAINEWQEVLTAEQAEKAKYLIGKEFPEVLF